MFYTGSKIVSTKAPKKPEKPPKKEDYFYIPPCVYCGRDIERISNP
jgi:hypothetical protein